MLTRRLLTLVALTLTVAACSKQPSPEEVAAKHLEDRLNLRIEEIYAGASSEDKKHRSLERLREVLSSDAAAAMSLLMAGKTTFASRSATVEGDAATVTVEITGPDLTAILPQLFGTFLGAAFKDDAERDRLLLQEVQNSLSKQNIPVRTETQTIRLTKEPDGWKVIMGWKEEEERLRRKERWDGMEREADRLRETGEWQAAIAAYDQLLVEAPDRTSAARNRERAAREYGEAQWRAVESAAEALAREGKWTEVISLYDEFIARTPDSRLASLRRDAAKRELDRAKDRARDARKKALEEAYISKVVLKDVKVADGQKHSFSDPEPGIFGTVVNTGDKTLKTVKITVYFLDREGKVVGEEDYHPVLVTDFSFAGDNKPLKPNYVKDFGYGLKKYAPSAWAGKVKTKITKVEFSGE